MNFSKIQPEKYFASLIWIFLLATLAHISFSHLGFNIGDDGFCLALAQRVLWGQIPHVEYLSLRPIGSGFLWAPVIHFFKDYSYLAVRFFSWLQYSLISYVWLNLVFEKHNYSNIRFFLLHLICFFLGTSVFTYYGWNTVDGMFFYTLGIVLLSRRQNRREAKFYTILSYFILGLCVLFKQNFMAMAVITPLILESSWSQKFKMIFIAIVPFGLYLFSIIFLGGANDLNEQLRGYSDFWTPGFWAYVGNKSSWRGLAFSLLLLVIIPWSGKKLNLIRGKEKVIEFVVIFLFWVYLLLTYFEGKWTYKGPFFVFGAALGLILVTLWESRRVPKFHFLALALAWVCSISGGYSTPIIGILALGPVFLSLWGERILNGKYISLFLIPLLLVWIKGRRDFIYGEWPAEKLTVALDGILPGGNGILTTPNNALALAEIGQITELFSNQRIAILPDYPGFWINFNQPNPMNIDWANHYELPNKFFEQKVLNHVQKFKGQGVPILLIQKFAGHTFSTLGEGKILPRQDRRSFLEYVVNNYELIHEGEFFNVFRP